MFQTSILYSFRKNTINLYIISIPAALKQTLQSQTNDLKAYKLKVQSLQNELIKVR